MKNFLILALSLVACGRLQAWPTVLFNPTNSAVVIPTNLVGRFTATGGNVITNGASALLDRATLTNGLYIPSVTYPVIDDQNQARFISISNWNGWFVVDPLGNVNIQGKISFGQYGYLEAANGNLGINSDVTIVGSLYGAFLDGSSITRGTVAAQYLPTITNQINSISGVITNGGVVWYFLRTNGVPAIAAPWGSLCSTTNGQLYVRSNTVWLLK